MSLRCKNCDFELHVLKRHNKDQQCQFIALHTENMCYECEEIYKQIKPQNNSDILKEENSIKEN